MGSVVYQNKNNHKENFSNYDTMFYEFRNYNASDVDVYFPSGAEYDSFISALNNEYSKTNDAKLVPYINAFPAWYQKSVIHDFQFFVQPKYKIAKDQPGSGNTKNIG